MAKNYTAYDAAAIIAAGMKKENALEYQDIMRRFPFFGAMCTKLDETALKLLEVLPEYMTARKLNRYIKENLGVEEVVADDIDEVEEEVEEPKKEKSKRGRKPKKVEPEEDDLEEEEEEKPKKKAKKVEKKKAKKEVEEDDDDDFDFDEDDEE